MSFWAALSKALGQKRHPAGAPDSKGGQFASSPDGVAAVRFDNPGGQWLADKVKAAEWHMKRSPKGTPGRFGLIGTTTASIGMAGERVTLPVAMLRKLPGAMAEKRRPGDAKFERLSQAVEAEGWRADKAGTVQVFVNHQGKAFLWEGNTRVALAARKGIDRLNVEVQWLNGGETVDGPWHPKRVVGALGRSGSVGKNLGQKRHPAGAPDGKGGQFAPNEGEGGGYPVIGTPGFHEAFRRHVERDWERGPIDVRDEIGDPRDWRSVWVADNGQWTEGDTHDMVSARYTSSIYSNSGLMRATGAVRVAIAATADEEPDVEQGNTVPISTMEINIEAERPISAAQARALRRLWADAEKVAPNGVYAYFDTPSARGSATRAADMARQLVAAQGEGASVTKAGFRDAIAKARRRHPAGTPWNPTGAGPGRFMAAVIAATGARTRDIRSASIAGAAGEKTFSGREEKIPAKHKLGGPGKQHEVGQRGEALALAYLKREGFDGTYLAGSHGADNHPFDLIAHRPGRGVLLVSVKAGQASNTRGAQQWRETLDYTLSKSELARFSKMTPEQQTKFRKQRQDRAIANKLVVAAQIERRLREEGVLKKGEGVAVRTVGVIFNDSTKQFDVHDMPGIHERTGWNSERAQESYVGTFRYHLTRARRMSKADDPVLALVNESGDRELRRMLKAVPRIAAEAKKLANASVEKSGFRLEVPLTKIDTDKRFIGGWASVIEVDGEPVVDRQGDIIEAEEMEKAAHDFMRLYRVGKVSHAGKPDKIEFVESIVLTKDKQEALGIDLGRVGWFVGGYVRDDATWDRVKAGELRSLSIGGSGERHDA